MLCYLHSIPFCPETPPLFPHAFSWYSCFSGLTDGSRLVFWYEVNASEKPNIRIQCIVPFFIYFIYTNTLRMFKKSPNSPLLKPFIPTRCGCWSAVEGDVTADKMAAPAAFEAFSFVDNFPFSFLLPPFYLFITLSIRITNAHLCWVYLQSSFFAVVACKKKNPFFQMTFCLGFL